MRVHDRTDVGLYAPSEGVIAIGQQGRVVNLHGFDCGICAVGVHIVPIERRSVVHRAFEAVARAVGIRHIQPLIAEAVDTALQAVGVVIGKREGFHGIFL